jgi:hypothetical protein
LSAQSAGSAAAPSAPATTAVSVAEARAIAEAFAATLESNFLFPETATRYASALRTKVAAGGYDKAVTREKLADMLTADVQAIAPDGHLQVFPTAFDFKTPAKPKTPSAPPPPEVEQMRWIAPEVAFVRFNSFLGTPESIEATRRFVREFGEARTLILDLRTHRGGGLDEMDILLSAVFAKPTRLLMMETRAAIIERDGDPLAAFPTIKTIPSPADVVRQEHWALPSAEKQPIARATIYVLTSGATASAGEHLALALKRTQRATLVGEPTAGAGHFGDILPLAHGFTTFMPVGRTYDPETGIDWEGAGVAPDIAITADRALAETLQLAGIEKVAAEQLSAQLTPQRPMARRARRAF